MKIIFFGTSEFAVPSLEKLHKSKHEVLAVVTQPDRKKGRNLKIGAPPIKEKAIELGIKDILQPQHTSTDAFTKILKAYKADIFCVVSYGHILRKKTLTLPPKSCINMHGSLLPKYRGAAPIRWAIINGEAKTGVSVIRMDESVDTGDIILKSKQVPVKKEDTYATLSEKLSVLGADSLLKAVDLIESGKASFTPQEDSQATPAPKLTKKDGLIDWGLAAEAICNRVRALEPWPGTYTFLNGKMLKVLEAEPAALRTSDVRKFRTSDVRRAAKPGEVILAAGDDIQVATGSGVLEVTKLQLEGSKAMDARAFLAGHDLKEGVMLCRN